MKRRNRVFVLVLLGMIGWAAFGAAGAGASTGPYFQYFSVFAYNTSTQMQTALDVIVVDPDGTVPDSIASLTVTGPNGFAYTFAPEDYQGGTTNEYWKTLSGLPADGEYTFTATDVDGNTAVTYFYLTVAGIIPLPDSSTYRASGTDPLTPTLSWSAIPGYSGRLYYRAKVLTMDDHDVWSSTRTYNLTSVTVPGGVLAEGQSYKWRVDAFDDFSLQLMSTRATADPIPLTISNTHPYFASVAAFAQHHPNGSVSTGLHARGADPAGSVSSVVVTEPNSAKHTYNGSALSCLNTSNGCSWNVSTAPVAGQYTFEVTNANNNTTLSYFYLDPYTVPLLDPETMHASGNPLTPVLSWSTPAATDRPLYYVVMVRNAATQAMVWSSWTVQNAISVPQGNLAVGVSYEWQVAPNDSSDFSFSNRSFSGWKSLSADNSSPFFWNVIALDRNLPAGESTYLYGSVRDANGIFPGNLKSLTVTGPNGFSYSFQPEDYFAPDNSLYHSFPGSPQEGLYTFTLTDNNNISVVTYDYHRQAGGTIPLLDEGSFRLFGDPLAPTISWSAVSGYPHDLYYSLQIVNEQDADVYSSPTPLPPLTFQTVPSGRLVAGPSYRYRVNAFDGRYGATADHRATSSYHPFGVPSIAGRVTSSLGSGLANISVQAYNTVTGASTPTILTDREGNYQFSNLPTGSYKIFFSGTGFFSQWYSGKADQASADPVVVTAPALTSGIDVVLEPSAGISGSVTNELGVGIANVNVQVCEPSGYMLAYAMTNSSGNYTVSGLSAGNYKVRFLASQGYRSEWYNDKSTQDSADLVTVTLPNITSGIDAVLGPGGSISGSIRNGQGTGIANVDIWVYDLNGWWMTGARTNQNGVYTANGLPGGSYRVLFTPLSSTGYSSEWYNNRSQQSTADPVAVTVPNVTSGIDAVLDLGGSISGTVKNQAGKGIANAQVQVYDIADMGMNMPRVTVTTTAKGGYTVMSLPTGTYKVFFQAGGYYSKWYNNKAGQDIADLVTVTAPNTTSKINVVLARSGGITGTVKNASGAGLQNVWVGVSSLDGAYLQGTPTDQSGKYTVSSLPSGTYKVNFNAPKGYRSEWYNNKKTFDTATPVTVTKPKITSGINAVLDAGGSIAGTVANEEGAGIANVDVQVVDLTGLWRSGARTGPNGSYTANGLAAGSYRVSFTPPAGSGYSIEWYDNKASQDSATNVSVAVSSTTSGIDAVLQQGGIVTVTSPNGGENWKVGTKCTIKWKYAGDIGESVRIDLLKGDTVVKTIAPNAASGTGSFAWKVPTTLAYGDDYRIAVTGNTITSRTDVSDASFTISGPTLDVTSPDGGESWRRGTQHDITWTFTGNPGGMVKIQLLKGGGILRTLTSACPIGTSGQGSFSWNVPQNLQVAANYQIKISHTVIAGCTGTSDSPFSIAKALAAVSAGPDQKVAEAETVKLSGANSGGFDKQKATFSWTQLDGPQTRLSRRTTLEPRLTAPEMGTEDASLMFLLTIIGEDGSQAQDSCIVNVSETNVPPTAAAGPTQTVAGGSLVVLDGSASFDPDDGILSYSWKQIAGTQVTLSKPTREQTTFTTPVLDIDGDVLLFELIVTDQGGLRARDTCIVNVTGASHPPLADAGENLAARPRSRVVLDGSGSHDPDGTIVSYRWTQLMGRPVTLSDPEAMRPSFILPSTTDIGNELVFQLTVTDNAGLQDKCRVVITIVEAPPEDTP